jgi:hypothetical protein
MLKTIRKTILSLLFIIIIVIILIYLLYFIIILSDNNYTSGRDTIESFGNGRFQIIRISNEKKELSDLKELKTIESDIQVYYQTENRVYIIGNNGYCILNCSEENYKQSKDLSDFAIEEQQIFNKLQK